jgi:hypothetical protein
MQYRGFLHADGQLMPISALEAITHSTHAFVAPWVQMVNFLLPGIYLARRRATASEPHGRDDWLVTDRSTSLLSWINEMGIFNIIKCANLGARELIGQTAGYAVFWGRSRTVNCGVVNE